MLIGTSAGSPLVPGRVGELMNCIRVIERVERLANQHIAYLKSLQEKDIEQIFPDPSLVQDCSLPWFEFTPSRVNNRLGWLEETLLTIVILNLNKTRMLRKQFVEDWDIDPGIILSPEAKAHIANMNKIWQAIQSSLENTVSDGPYRIEMIRECRSHLQKLSAEISKMTGRARDF